MASGFQRLQNDETIRRLLAWLSLLLLRILIALGLAAQLKLA
jgi:hypothetical protein